MQNLFCQKRLTWALRIFLDSILIISFASFDNSFFKLTVIYSVGDAGKFNPITTIVLLILQYLNFQAFNLFLRVTTHSHSDNFLDENSVQFNICSNDDSPKGNSQSNNDRSDKIVLKHKTFKENLFKVYNDHTADEKTSNEYSDDELINFNLVGTATNASNPSSINKNNSNACDITNAYEEKQ